MRRPLVWLTLFAIGSVAYALPQGAVRPTADSHPVLDVSRLEAFLPERLDLQRLGEEDMMDDRLGIPPRFAVPEKVSISPATHGTWEELSDGQMLWRLRIIGREGTTSLNLGFSRFKMSPGARLLLYSADGSLVGRPFTAADNEKHGELWTPVVTTSDLVVELTVPRLEKNEVELTLGTINQGYRGFGTVSHQSYEKSGSCNLDVECLAVGDTWREEMRAVGVISTGGSRFCTGSLLNNTAGDRKMFFITAAHCGINSGNAASLVVYWNYQNSFCRTPGSAASGSAGNGSLSQFHTGSFFRASYTPSDVTLVELDDPPVAAYNHHWAGWDRSTGSHTCTSGAPCASIHHPSTDEKRITYVTTNMVSTSYSGTTSPGDGTHLWAKWATAPIPGGFTVPGVTEPGSSGSPLYNSAGRYVGQLHGGPSSCGATGNNLSDYYGRFSVSWTGGGTNSTRLSNWLDAGNTGATTTNGIDASSGPCTPPPVPTGLTATPASQSQINLSWGAASGASSYTISRSTTNGGPYATAGTSGTTSFSNTGLACNTTYYYVVSSSNGTCSSANSSQAQATTSACTCNNISDTEPNNSTGSPQVISGTCNQISGTFLNDASNQRNDYFRISLPAGATVTALLNGLTVDYDLFIYNAAGTQVASSELGGTSADTASYTNTSGAAANVFIRAYRFSSTRTTYQLRISF